MSDTVLLWLLNIGYLLYLAAYAVRDILWLRLLTIVGGFAVIPYFLKGGSMSSVYWTGTYVAINLVNLALLIHERRPVTLTPDQERLRMLLFRAFSPREFLRFVSPAEWRDTQLGQQLYMHGTVANGLMAILDGEAIVKVNDKEVARLHNGQFIGEMSFITGETASADVFAGENLRYVFWSRDTLDQVFQRYPHYQHILNSILGVDMAAKLDRSSDRDLADYEAKRASALKASHDQWQ